jgi:TetR/AcrR family transcriptional regulator
MPATAAYYHADGGKFMAGRRAPSRTLLSNRPRRAATKRAPAAPAGAIRQRNVGKILKAAEAVFAKKGFSGASTAEIARLAGVPKPNLHYYFRTKQALYESVLDRILEMWLDAMDEIQPDADPAEALTRYLARKIELSRLKPGPSRLWAMEILAGAPHIGAFLRGRVRALVGETSVIIHRWIAEGRIRSVDPAHLLFVIWASTQTYADFAAQIAAVLRRKRLDPSVFDGARETVTTLILNGLGLER